jgi:hypothetical protein
MKRRGVMMPSEQYSLEQDCECADERAGSARPLPSPHGANPYGEAHLHLDLSAPAYIRPNAAISTRSGDDIV